MTPFSGPERSWYERFLSRHEVSHENFLQNVWAFICGSEKISSKEGCILMLVQGNAEVEMVIQLIKNLMQGGFFLTPVSL